MVDVLGPIVLLVAWITWVPAVVLEKRATGETGGVSVFPILPVSPLAAWGLAVVLNLAGSDLGWKIVGGLHAILLAANTGSAVRSWSIIRRRRREPHRQSADTTRRPRPCRREP